MTTKGETPGQADATVSQPFGWECHACLITTREAEAGPFDFRFGCGRWPPSDQPCQARSFRERQL